MNIHPVMRIVVTLALLYAGATFRSENATAQIVGF